MYEKIQHLKTNLNKAVIATLISDILDFSTNILRDKKKFHNEKSEWLSKWF